MVDNFCSLRNLVSAAFVVSAARFVVELTVMLLFPYPGAKSTCDGWS